MTPQAEFQAAVLDQLRRAPLDPPAQAALLQALTSVVPREGAVTAKADGPLAEWLGEPPANPAQLEFEALRRSFALRHQLLACTIGTAEVNELLAAGSRQTVHDRLKAGTLLGILDQGKWRFPLWQFDADGPNGVIDGLAQVLQALQVSNLAKARWLQKPHPVFGGSTPLDLIRHGHLEDVLVEAGQVGRGQD
ncbi:antitoxin Xre/MbcA/ParS toxin-binding domain-containing protein [Vulcanococcus limneticus]|uniref:antitoxin Xre/MbcA/ParS toxin-binding domain-containing protein n=1 Tax=Vulcanococcus limneticus TaxID=2170428 RepID=UPI00398C05A4